MIVRGCWIAAALVALAPTVCAKAVEYAPGVKLGGGPIFQAQTRYALDRLRKTPTGRAILRAIAVQGRKGRATTIVQEYDADGWASIGEEGFHTVDGGPGRGWNALIGWNPIWKPEGLPAEVILAHELIHALHSLQGRTDWRRVDNPNHPDDDTRFEEIKTVGIKGFDKSRLTENRVRRDWNRVFGTKLPVRHYYAHLYGPTLESVEFVLDDDDDYDESEESGYRPGARRPGSARRPGGRRRGAVGVLKELR